MLKMMLAAEEQDDLLDAEIVCDRGVCYVGEHRTNRATVNRLLRLCVIRDVSDTKGCDRFVLNEEGRMLARNPKYIPEIVRYFK